LRIADLSTASVALSSRTIFAPILDLYLNLGDGRHKEACGFQRPFGSHFTARSCASRRQKILSYTFVVVQASTGLHRVTRALSHRQALCSAHSAATEALKSPSRA
jgi:hypothetical protein